RATLLAIASGLDQLHFEHRVRMRRETVSHLLTSRGSRTAHGFDLRAPEIVLAFDIRTVYFGDANFVRKLLVLGFDLGLNGLILAAVDNIEHERAIIVGRRCVELSDVSKAFTCILRTLDKQL